MPDTYDGTTNMRANYQCFEGSTKKDPSSLGKDAGGTDSPRVTTQTFDVTPAATPSGKDNHPPVERFNDSSV